MESLEEILIRFKTLRSDRSNEDVFQIRVPKNTSIIDLKKKIEREHQVPVQRQRIIFRGRALKDEKNLEFYSVQDGNTLHMVIRPLNAPQTPILTARETEQSTSNESTRDGSGSSWRVFDIPFVTQSRETTSLSNDFSDINSAMSSFMQSFTEQNMTGTTRPLFISSSSSNVISTSASSGRISSVPSAFVFTTSASLPFLRTARSNNNNSDSSINMNNNMNLQTERERESASISNTNTRISSEPTSVTGTSVTGTSVTDNQGQAELLGTGNILTKMDTLLTSIERELNNMTLNTNNNNGNNNTEYNSVIEILSRISFLLGRVSGSLGTLSTTSPITKKLGLILSRLSPAIESLGQLLNVNDNNQSESVINNSLSTDSIMTSSLTTSTPTPHTRTFTHMVVSTIPSRTRRPRSSLRRSRTRRPNDTTSTTTLTREDENMSMRRRFLRARPRSAVWVRLRQSGESHSQANSDEESNSNTTSSNSNNTNESNENEQNINNNNSTQPEQDSDSPIRHLMSRLGSLISSIGRTSHSHVINPIPIDQSTPSTITSNGTSHETNNTVNSANSVNNSVNEFQSHSSQDFVSKLGSVFVNDLSLQEMFQLMEGNWSSIQKLHSPIKTILLDYISSVANTDSNTRTIISQNLASTLAHLIVPIDIDHEFTAKALPEINIRRSSYLYLKNNIRFLLDLWLEEPNTNTSISESSSSVVFTESVKQWTYHTFFGWLDHIAGCFGHNGIMVASDFLTKIIEHHCLRLLPNIPHLSRILIDLILDENALPRGYVTRSKNKRMIDSTNSGNTQNKRKK